ncbi:MAG TPA: helix-turn-helix domain-containing protein [Bryobacteraceae bacterium]|nr:helix-turn-helix domain-containing protein [Bryobacteraceae bacterium]
MEYCEFSVPPLLASHFLCLWTQTAGGKVGEYTHRVLPDACIDIVFMNDDPPVVVGPRTESFMVRLPAGTSIIGARLYPGRAPSLLGLPAAEILNRSIPLLAVSGGLRKTRFDRVFEESNAAARLSALTEALVASLKAAAPLDEAVAASVRWVGCHPVARIEQLSRSIGISHRQLQRRFLRAVGYGPKMFQSVLRFQRLLKIAKETGVQRTLANLAADAGYTDQAHMTREFRRFGGVQPTALLRSAKCTLQMSDLFKT